MRVVLDANVWVSSIINPNGACALVLKVSSRLCDIYISDNVRGEVLRAITSKVRVSTQLVIAMKEFLTTGVVCATPCEIEVSACRDPDDLHILGLAVAAKADCIVTGDRDLLVLKAYRDIPILTPSGFLERLTPRDKKDA